jgi:hypothetical protein
MDSRELDVVDVLNEAYRRVLSRQLVRKSLPIAARRQLKRKLRQATRAEGSRRNRRLSRTSPNRP